MATTTTTKPYQPFQPEPIPFSLSSIADQLQEIIPTMGAQGPTPLTSEKPIRVEEQYEVNERYALPTSLTPSYYDVKTTEPKTILLVADGADQYVDFNQQISTDSPKIFNGGSLSTTSKGVVRIWAQTVTAAASTLRILVLKR
jgi:hypothetical protein